MYQVKLALPTYADYVLTVYYYFFCDSNESYLASLALGSGMVTKTECAPQMLLPKWHH